MYDDRGVDVIARNREALGGLYHDFNPCILDYDRVRIDERFRHKQCTGTSSLVQHLAGLLDAKVTIAIEIDAKINLRRPGIWLLRNWDGAKLAVDPQRRRISDVWSLGPGRAIVKRLVEDGGF